MYSCMQKNEFGPNSYHVQTNSKWIIEQNSIAKTTKIIEENVGVNLHDLGLSNYSLDMTPKAQVSKQ